MKTQSAPKRVYSYMGGAVTGCLFFFWLNSSGVGSGKDENFKLEKFFKNA